MLEVARSRTGFAALLGDSAGFRANPVYGARPERPDQSELAEAERRAAEDRAYQRGLADGHKDAASLSSKHLEDELAARGVLGENFARIEERLALEMADKLREAAVALCCETLAPAAMDTDLLEKRIDKAIEMIGHAERRVLKVNPADLPFIAERLKSELLVEADDALSRGSLRIETPEGGIEDGPDTWRKAIEEAIRSC